MFNKRLFRQIILTLLIFAVGISTVGAGSPHFIGSVRFSFGSLRAVGDLAGLGNLDVTVRLDAYAKVTALCQNRGGSIAPGRNPVSVSTVVTDIVVPDQNGKAYVELVAHDPLTIQPLPPSPSPKTAGCPNGNWTVVGFMPGSTQWTGARITVFDNRNGAVLLVENYACAGTGSALTCWEV